MENDLKASILQRSNNGLDFFKLILGDILQKENETRFKNIKNPFYNDKNASLSIYQNSKGIWSYKDYGNVEFSGDVFHFCALYYKVDVKKEFTALLNLMDYDLKHNKLMLHNNNLVECEYKSINKSQVVGVKLSEVDFSKEALDYWLKFGITIEILRLNNVVQITGYQRLFSDDRFEKHRYFQSQVLYAYKLHNCAKLYIPNPKDFFYVGKKPKNYVFGQSFNNESNLVFVVGGEKDVLTLHSLGYQAICFNSETSMPSKEICKQYYEDQINAVIMYDCDEAGKKGAEKLSEKTNWRIADLFKTVPIEKQNGIKDISDYIANKLPLQPLKEFLNSFLESIVEIKETEDLEEIEDLESKGFENEEKTSENNYAAIPQCVYDNLPLLLKDIISQIDQAHKKDLVLTGSLSLLSNLINVKGVYNGVTTYPNLYLFITAPASAGKSVLNWVRKLGNSLNRRFTREFKIELDGYKENGKKGDVPKKQSVFVSANSSIAAFLNQLHINNGRGIMLETEADALNDVMKNGWGNLSDVLRRCFEFEMISSLRVDSEKSFDIEKPRLSIILSGTKNQLFELMPSAQNGLFSRFLFFEFPLVKDWEDVFEKKESLDSYYNEISEKVLMYYDKTINANINFGIKKNQSERFNKFYKQKQNEFDLLLGEDSIASVRRIGSMQFRIAMLLSTIRMLDNNNFEENLSCEDKDFETSEVLARWFMNHTKKIYQQLPNKAKQYKELKTLESKLLEKLPNKFTFRNGVEIAESISIPKGTFENILKRFQKYKLVTKYSQGLYIKSED